MTRSFCTPSGETLTLDASQDRAVTTVLTALQKPGSEATLAGAAGCGKSVLMLVVAEEWKGSVLLLAPTGKAAHRLAEVTGREVSTIHSAVFKTADEVEEGEHAGQVVFGDPATPDGVTRGTLVIIDEASMVDEKLAAVVRKVCFAIGARILWVGDHEQLPPVSGRWGARLDRPTACLETVHRQALGSPILELATLIRQRKARTFTRWGGEVQRVHPATIQQAVTWMEEGREVDAPEVFAPEDQEVTLQTRILLTWTNKVRAHANYLMRQGREYPRDRVVDGESLLCTFNNHALGRMNGEIVEVDRAEECPELTQCLGVRVQWVHEKAAGDAEAGSTPAKFLVIPGTFDKLQRGKSERQVYRDAWKPLWASRNPRDPGDETSFQLRARMGWSRAQLDLWRRRAKRHGLQATWGYCLTAHKSQGSQYDEVGFISCPGFRRYEDTDFRRRLTYTVITRASKRFIAFMVTVVPGRRRY
jgi:exodeoxyribonuclease V